MNCEDLLKSPQLFAVKKDGQISQDGVLCNDAKAVKAAWLFRQHRIVVNVNCDDPKCDCVNQAWTKSAEPAGAQIVEVQLVEVEEKKY